MRTTSSGKAISRIEQREIYLTRYPFSNGEFCKLRPALILSNSRYNSQQLDVLASPLTSNLKQMDYSILVDSSDMERGKLKTKCRIRCDKIGALEKALLVYKIGKLNQETFERVKTEIFAVLAE